MLAGKRLRPFGGALPVPGATLARIAHEQGEVGAGHALVHEVEHERVRHLAQHHARLLELVVPREHLAAPDGVGARPVRLDLLDGAGLDSPGMVDEQLRVDAKLVVEHLLGEQRHLAQAARPHRREAPRESRPYAPYVGDGAVRPDEALEALLVELPDVVRGVLCRDVERHLGEKEVGPDARRGADSRLAAHERDELDGQLAWRPPVKGKVGPHVHEALVDRVHVDVLRREVPEVEGVDLRGNLHVAPHARAGHLVVDVIGNLEDPAAVAHAERLHCGGYGQADGLLAARGVRDDEARLEWVVPAVHALDRRVEALEVYAEIRVRHGSPFHKHLFPSRDHDARPAGQKFLFRASVTNAATLVLF